MTRINANISIKELTDQHLLAEHREIKRVCNRYSKRLEKGDKYVTQTHDFTLGKGHELFFIDKGKFTLDRYISIREECKLRGFNITDFESSWDVYLPKHMNQHIMTIKDNNIIRERISDNIKKSNQIPKYYGRTLTKDEAIALLKFNE